MCSTRLHNKNLQHEAVQELNSKGDRTGRAVQSQDALNKKTCPQRYPQFETYARNSRMSLEDQTDATN